MRVTQFFLNLIVVTACLSVSTVLAEAPPIPPGANYAPDTVLIKFKPGTPANEKASVRGAAGVEVVRSFRLVPGLEVVTAKNRNVEKVIESVSNNPNVAYAEPDYEASANTTYTDDFHIYSPWGLERIGAPHAWDTTTGDPNYIVAVVDTGVDHNHEDLAANIWTNPGEIPGNGVDDDGNGYIDDVRGYDWVNDDNNPWDDRGHGSHVSGTICAKGDNGIGVVGVAWNCQIMALKFLGSDGIGYYSDAIAAIDYAVAMGVRVSNHSWGGSSYSQSLYDAIANARAAQHLIVAAAGNDSKNIDNSPEYPAAYDLDNIISVANTQSDDSLRSSSNWGVNSVDLGAPGSSIISTTPGNNYQYYWGTSMAAPHVAGALALLASEFPSLGYQQLRDSIFDSVEPLAAVANNTVTGGQLDVPAALTAASTMGNGGIVNTRVAYSSDDAEERVSDGKMYPASTDLEMVHDSWEGVADDQLVGIRFRSVNIPQGATILSTYLEFTTDEAGSDATTVTFRAQDSDNAAAFTSTTYNIFNRPTTSASTSWSIGSWSTIGKIRISPDLKALVQEVVDRSGWRANNSMAFIITGSGTRTVEAYDGEPASAPLLRVHYSIPTTPPTNLVPTADFSYVPSDLNVSFVDTSLDSDGDIVAWSWDLGDGNSSSAQSLNHSYATAGTYTVSLTVTDNDSAADSTSKDVTVTESPPLPPAEPIITEVKDNTDGSATITWNYTGAVLTGFELVRQKAHKKRRNSWTETVALNPVSAEDVWAVTDSSGAGTFRWGVRAMNGFAASEWVYSANLTVSDGGGSEPQQCPVLLPSGAECTSDGECCSSKCKGKPGRKTCN